MIRTTVLALLTLVMGAVSAPIYAHSMKAAITKVVFNPRTENLEIMHRFLLHDAEHAVKQIFDKKADIIGSAETQQRFADYVAARFEIKDETGKTLPLKPVGHELEGKFFWIYQEVSIPNTKSLSLQHDALRDLWPTQVNTVNVEGNLGLETATFDGNIEIATIELKDIHKHH